MKKRLIIVLIILLVMGLGSFGVYKLAKGDDNKNGVDKSTEDGNVTISGSIIIDLLDNMNLDSYKIEDLTFKDVNVFVNDGKDSFEATLLCEDARDNLNIEIILYDKNKKKINSLDFNLKDITENDERVLFCFVDEDLYDVYSFEVIVK